MNEEIKIEDGIPIPETRGAKQSSPVRELKVGQSFFVKTDNRKNKMAFFASCYFIARKLGIKITIRSVDDGLRVWRLQ